MSLLSLATAASFVGCVAIGMTFITLGGNVMSFALGVTLPATTVVFVSLLPFGLWAALAVALAFSASLTAAQGWLVGTLRANPIIVSLAALSLITGAATWLTGGMGVYPDENAADALRGQVPRHRRPASPTRSCPPWRRRSSGACPCRAARARPSISGGVLVLCVLRAVMSSVGLPPFVQDIATGGVLVVVAAMDAEDLRRRLHPLLRRWRGLTLPN